MAIPGHLVFAFEEGIAELIRRLCDSDGGPEANTAVIEAVHLRDAFVAGALTAAQVAGLAASAADWRQSEWPKAPEAVDGVERLAAATRGLLELRDHALAMAANTTNIGRVVAVDSALGEVLRSQSLRRGLIDMSMVSAP